MPPMPADACLDRALLGYSGGNIFAFTLTVSGPESAAFGCQLVAVWSANVPP